MNRLIRSVCVSLISIHAAFPASAALPSNSIYNLQAVLMDQSGVSHGLDAYKGRPVLVTMFYGSCPAACPLLIDTLRAVERTLNDNQRSQLRILMISIDPVRDTSPALLKLAGERRVNLSTWTLAHTDAATVREIGAVLNVQYRQLPNGDFNHSSLITLLSAQGEILYQSDAMGAADSGLMQALTELLVPR